MTLDHNDKRAIRNLLTALEEKHADLVPREMFRTPNNGVVEGWRIIFGPGRDFTVTRPGTPGDVAFDRVELVTVLRREWAPKAAVAVDLPVTPVAPAPVKPAATVETERRWAVVFEWEGGPTTTTVEATDAFAATKTALRRATSSAELVIDDVVNITITEERA